jgi:hypothetical protein
MDTTPFLLTECIYIYTSILGDYIVRKGAHCLSVVTELTEYIYIYTSILRAGKLLLYTLILTHGPLRLPCA